MDEYTADAFTHRNEAVPQLAVSQNDVDPPSSETDTGDQQNLSKKSLPPREKGQSVMAAPSEKAGGQPGKASIQDRLFSKILQQVIPTEDDEDDTDLPVDPWSSQYVQRPAFSLPLMTNNFRRFNARVGIVFVFQNRLIRLLSWRTPTQTLSFLAIYTFVCLDPHLLAAVPLAAILLSVMVPAFTSRHPPPPPQHTVSVTMPYYSTYAGPAIAPAPTIKPASETSKDFFRNMRDLQNSMADFSNVYDVMVSTITPATNFSNEVSSSALFLYLTVATCLLFISAHLLPWRLIFLLVGYGLTISMHPTAQTWLIKSRKHAQEQATLALSDAPIQEQKRIYSFPLPTTPAALRSTLASFSAITLSTTPETREVEIFELQHRPLSSSISSTNAAEWQPHVFTPSPYDPLSPSRIAGERPEGTRFFEDVQPPEGWEWASKKWELDLEAGEWVNDRLVVGVAYDVLHRDNNDQASSGTASTDSREGVSGEFGGWVWDLPPAPGGSGNRDEELWLAYGDYQVPSVGQRDDEKKKGKNKDKTKKEPAGRDWEEATRFGSSGRTGEWRRRRWVRLVKRRLMGGTTGEGGSGG